MAGLLIWLPNIIIQKPEGIPKRGSILTGELAIAQLPIEDL